MSPQIREAGPGEEAALLVMYDWLFAPPGNTPPGWDPDRARAALAATIEGPRSAFLVAEVEAEQVGFCTAYLDLDSVRFGLRCWVEDLAVGPDRRSQGVGAALLAAAKHWAGARGATHLELDSGIARTDAHRFYEREKPSWTGMQYAWLL